jgi:hypothetical protein
MELEDLFINRADQDYLKQHFLLISELGELNRVWKALASGARSENCL